MPKRRVIIDGHARTDGALRVAHIVGELHLLAVIEQRRGIGDHLRIERVEHFVAALERAERG